MKRSLRPAIRFTLVLPAVLAGVISGALGGPSPAAGHGPDPVLGGTLWAANQDVRFRWRTGEEPPSIMQTAIRNAAADVNGSRNSKAATFTYDPAGASWINYGLDVACGVNGLACFSRAGAPSSFTMSFREQGHVFDWGVMKWCQFWSSPPDGCYDAETIALDEFGHVEILNHHVNYSDDRDYLDAVVQTYSRTKPKLGWNARVLARCDVASLQLEYDLPAASSKVSTCLDVDTTLGLTASSTYLNFNGAVTFTASLAVTTNAAYGRLSANALSGRTVVLQARPSGATTWSTVGPMAAGTTTGTYTYRATYQTTTTDWRAVFTAPADEGLNSSTSPVVNVGVSSCRSIICPVAGIRGPAQ